MRIAVKEVGQKLKVVETKEKYRSDAVKEFLGKNFYATYVKIEPDDTFSYAVIEDGLLRKLPFNFFSEINNTFSAIQPMVGPAVFVRTKKREENEDDYEVTDLTDADILFIQELLDDDNQNELKECYNYYTQMTIRGLIPVKFEVMYRLKSNLAMAIYQMSCAALTKNLDDFYMPLCFIQKNINFGKEQEQFSADKPDEEILKEVCNEISEKANISLEYVKKDEKRVFFSVEQTVVVY